MLSGVVGHQETGPFGRSRRPDCGADGDLKSSSGCLDETASSAVSSAEVSGVSIIAHFSNGFSFRSVKLHLEESKIYFRAAEYAKMFFFFSQLTWNPLI